MELLGVRAVMVFVTEPHEAAAWWSSVTGIPARQSGEFAWLGLADGLELGFHPVDDARNPRGGSPVVYWAVSDLLAARDALLRAGAEQHRGPLEVAPGRWICQVKDPFDVVVGLDGPRSVGHHSGGL